MIKYGLSVVTDQQKSYDKAKKLGDILSSFLHLDAPPEIKPYHKFEHSFRMEFTGTIEENSDTVTALVALSDRICSPWLIYYDNELKAAELIFNRENYSRFRDQRFQVIRWANLFVLNLD